MCLKKGAHKVCCCCFMHRHHVWTGWPRWLWNNPTSHSHDTNLCQIQIKRVNGTGYSCQQTQDTYWAHELYWRTQLPSKLPMKTWTYLSLDGLTLLQSREVVVKYGEFVPAGICHAFHLWHEGNTPHQKKSKIFTALLLHCFIASVKNNQQGIDFSRSKCFALHFKFIIVL